MRKVKKQKLTRDSCRSTTIVPGKLQLDNVEFETATPKETAQQIYDDLKNGAEWDDIVKEYLVDVTSIRTAEYNNEIIRELNKLYPKSELKFAEYTTSIFI